MYAVKQWWGIYYAVFAGFIYLFIFLLLRQMTSVLLINGKRSRHLAMATPLGGSFWQMKMFSLVQDSHDTSTEYLQDDNTTEF